MIFFRHVDGRIAMLSYQHEHGGIVGVRAAVHADHYRRSAGAEQRDAVRFSGAAQPARMRQSSESGKSEPVHQDGVFCGAESGNALGNAGRNVTIGPGILSLDTPPLKNNRVPRISETFNVQFRAELFNVLNHANFSPPAATSLQLFSQTLAPVTSAGILTATSTTSRQVLFALKVIW